jgi:hypothetical protein
MNAWAAVLPLIGLVVGAVLQYWFTTAAESRKQLRLLQSQCYVDYLKAVTRTAHAHSPEIRRQAVAETADAKARISVYGEPKVIFALARFEEAGVVLDNPRSLAAFVAFANAMRAGNIEARDLMLVLFGVSKE